MVLDFLSPDVMVFATSFLFVFAVVFALLLYTKVFKESRGAMAIIAAVIAFSAAFYQGSAVIIQQIMPIASIVLVALFFFVFVKKIFEGGEEGKKKDVWPIVIMLAIALILLGLFWPQIANMAGLGGIDADNALWIVGIVIVIMIFWAAYSYGSGGGEAAGAAPRPAGT
jgi:FlaA1/EpsC-like NDP-sugar epimerase